MGWPWDKKHSSMFGNDLDHNAPGFIVLPLIVGRTVDSANLLIFAR